MLKRTISSITNRRLLSLTAIVNRHQSRSRNLDEYSHEVNKQPRPYEGSHPRSTTVKNRMQEKREKQQSDVPSIPRFNNYNVTRWNSKKPHMTRSGDGEENDLFGEEKDDLTMVGTDRKAFSSSTLTTRPQRPSPTAVSLNRKTEPLNIPLEVLIEGDLRDLYTTEEIDHSLEVHINEMSPSLRPFTFDLAYLINESTTLKRFIEMGVDVYRWNQPNAKAKYILTLDFDGDCLSHLVFLNELGIKNKDLSSFVSSNPWIFKETIDDLRVRVNYLESKGFTSENIQHILIRAPFLLNLSTKMLETKLHWFQRKFRLTNIEHKDFVLRAPKLLTLPLQQISNTYFQMNTKLDFEHDQLKRLFTLYPKLYIYDYQLIELNFDFLFNEMNICRARLLDYPPILKQSFQQLRTRCLYLKYLKKHQFDPTKANFISLKDLCLQTNELFCQHVTKTSLRHYMNFIKTL